MKAWFQAAVLALSLAACSTVPNDIGGNVDPTITLARVRGDGALAQGQLVRWGGLIARVQNKEGQTWIEIVEKPLTSYGSPVDANITNGRFIAIFEQFLDPMVFQLGREITIMGSVQPAVDGKIDEQPYKYVVVAASGFHLWQPRPDYRADDYIMMQHGFWDPWWYRPVYIRHIHTVPTARPIPPQPNSTLPTTIPRTPREEPARINVPGESTSSARIPRAMESDDHPKVMSKDEDRKESKKR